MTLLVEIDQHAVAAVTQLHKMLSCDFGLGIERFAAYHARCASGHWSSITNILLRRYRPHLRHGLASKARNHHGDPSWAAARLAHQCPAAERGAAQPGHARDRAS